METEPKNLQRNNSLPTAAAIIVAGIIIAIAVASQKGATSNNAPLANAPTGNAPQIGQQAPVPGSGAENNVIPVSVKDHIRGNPDAPVKIVEFSDTECPFCKKFHPTLQQAVTEYDGKVAWAYRHFPLDSLHSKARKEAEATECAGELGGNEKFWAYLDRLFEVTPANNGLDPAQLHTIAQYVGLDMAKFNTCLESGKYAQRVAADLADATNSGGAGTPYTIVIAQNGKKFVVSGAQPYAVVKSTIEAALAAQ